MAFSPAAGCGVMMIIKPRSRPAYLRRVVKGRLAVDAEFPLASTAGRYKNTAEGAAETGSILMSTPWFGSVVITE